MPLKDTGKKTPFHPSTVLAKLHFKRLRIQSDLTMNKGAAKLGLSRKQLEDVETQRPYGCHIDWLLLLKACKVYGVTPDEFIKPMNARDRDFYTAKYTGKKRNT